MSHMETIYLLELSKQVVELTTVKEGRNDLDVLLERMYLVLEKLPQFGTQRQGAIYMFNSCNLPVRVAQYGLKPSWLQNPDDDPLQGFHTPFSKQHVIERIQLAGGSCQGLLVLPLHNGTEPLGQIALFIDPEWEPAAAEVEFLNTLARAMSGVISRFLLDEILAVREYELKEARADAILRLGSASEYRDNETGMHVMRMTAVSVAIAKEMGLSPEDRELLSVTAPMHDVGKIGIADAIMLKPDRLTPDEFDVMKTHTEIGSKLLKGRDTLLTTARDIALCHHENWDGSGYPAGLHGEQIPLFARICALADVFDALMSERPYKKAWPLRQSIDWINSQSGLKFDPAVVVAFDNALPEIMRIRELYRDEIIDPQQVQNLPDLPYHQERWINWDETLSVGIAAIDEHHRYLFDLTNDLIDVAVNRAGSHELRRVLKALGEYAEIHFNAEEMMMEQSNYDHLSLQKEQHKYFLQRLNGFHLQLHENPLVAQNELISFLENWLIAHIRDEDSRLASLAWR